MPDRPSPKTLSRFTDRTVVIATMHRKEAAIAPLLEPTLGVRVTVPPQFNTDAFGTFSRDVDRPGDQYETARIKAEKALAVTGATLAIASEGSFGPHPQLPWLACDREIVLLLDREHDLEIVGEALSTDTNFRHQTVTTLAAAQEFAAAVQFPSHGLIAMPQAQPAPDMPIFKGLTTDAALTEALTQLFDTYGQAHLETDMRAMHNPSRMRVIAAATEDLLQRLAQTCPQCDRPGFAIVDHRIGLPCGLCGLPTQLALAAIYRCAGCGHEQEQRFPNGQQVADPGLCSYCNP